MTTEQFDLPVGATINVQSRSGSVEVVAEPRDDVLVEGDGFEARAEDGGRTLVIRSGRGGSKNVQVRCPVGSDVVIGTHSGKVRTSGELGTVSATTMSASIDVDRADEADLRTGSGNITLASAQGRTRMNTLSGRIRAGTVGACACGTMSGAIKVDRVVGPLKARSVSGSIEAGCDGEGAIVVKTVSGKVSVSVPEGTGVSARVKSLSGRVRCLLPEGDDLNIEAMTVSGLIEVVPSGGEG